MNIASVNTNLSSLRAANNMRVATSGSLGRFPRFFDVAGMDPEEDLYDVLMESSIEAPEITKGAAGKEPPAQKAAPNALEPLKAAMRLMNKGVAITKAIIL